MVKTKQVIPLQIISKKLYLEILNSTVENTLGGMLIQKTDGGLADSLVEASG